MLLLVHAVVSLISILSYCLLFYYPRSDSAPQDYKNTTCVGACSVGESISIIRKKKWTTTKEKNGGKKEKGNESNDDGVTNCSVLTWNIPNTEPGSNRILSERSSIISEFQMGRREKVINICGHANSRSLSILLAPSSSSLTLKNGSSSSDSNSADTEFRWLKFDNYDGTLLFERKGSKKESNITPKSPINIIACGNFLWMIFNGKACLWDARYGVELISLPVNIPEVLKNSLNCLASEDDVDCINRSSGLSMIFTPEGVSSSQLSSYYLTVCIPHKVGASLFHIVLKIPTTQISGILLNGTVDCFKSYSFYHFNNVYLPYYLKVLL